MKDGGGIRLHVDREALESVAAALVPRIADAVVERLTEWRPLAETSGSLERVIGVDQLAQHLGISRSAVTSRIRAEKLPAPREIAGSLGWTASELNAHFRAPTSLAPGGSTSAGSTVRGRPGLSRPKRRGRNVSGPR